VPLNGEPVPVGDGADEVNLDIDVIHAIAPKATLLNYEAQNSWENFIAIIERIVTDKRASIVSVSWGKCLPRVPPKIISAMQGALDKARKAAITVQVDTVRRNDDIGLRESEPGGALQC